MRANIRTALLPAIFVGCGFLWATEDPAPPPPAPPASEVPKQAPAAPNPEKPKPEAQPEKTAPPAPDFLKRTLAPGRWVEFEAAGLPGMEAGDALSIRFSNLGETEKDGKKTATLEMRLVPKKGGQRIWFQCATESAKISPLENPFAEAKSIIMQIQNHEPWILDETEIKERRDRKGRSSQLLRFATQKNGLVPFMKDIDWKEAGKEKVKGVEATVREGVRRKDADPAWTLTHLRLLESDKVPLGIAGLESKGTWKREGAEKPVDFDAKLSLEGSGEGAKTEIVGEPGPVPNLNKGP